MVFYKTTQGESSNGNWRLLPRSSAGSRCVVCGDPSSNCKSEGAEANPRLLFESEAPADKRMFLVENDVIEERQITPGRTTKIILARKGSYITKTRATELGLLSQAQ